MSGTQARITRRAVLGVLAAAPFAARALSLPAMQTRAIPASGELLPVIGLGTWQTLRGDGATRAAEAEVLRVLVEQGGRLVDSSPMYGPAESALGELAAQAGIADRLFYATKVWTQGREAGIAQMEQSYARMRVKRMDLMQIHNLVDAATHLATLRKWREQGRLRYIGITHYHAGAHAELEQWLVREKLDFLQVNYSLAEPEAGERLLRVAAERGVAVIANRPFAEGALFGKVRGKPLPGWAGAHGAQSWAQFFLQWIVSHPAITCAIPATSNPRHMADNLAAGALPVMDAAARSKAAEAFARL